MLTTTGWPCSDASRASKRRVAAGSSWLAWSCSAASGGGEPASRLTAAARALARGARFGAAARGAGLRRADHDERHQADGGDAMSAVASLRKSGRRRGRSPGFRHGRACCCRLGARAGVSPDAAALASRPGETRTPEPRAAAPRLPHRSISEPAMADTTQWPSWPRPFPSPTTSRVREVHARALRARGRDRRRGARPRHRAPARARRRAGRARRRAPSTRRRSGGASSRCCSGSSALLSEDEPHLADGTLLSAHQVDALSGTLTALLAEAPAQRQRQRQRRPCGAVGRPSCASSAIPGEEDDDEEDERDEEPRDWDEPARRRRRGRQLDEQPEDPNAAKRFWFEHATGAGKTVAALGFVEASRTGGILILTHRRNLVDQFHGELRDRGYAQPHLAGRCSSGKDRGRRPGHRRDLPVVRAQRGQDLRRLHDRHLRRGPHRAGREDERRDPQLDRPDLHRHDRDRRADRPPRHRPLPDADLALRPRPGRAPRRHRAAALRPHPARARACARSPRCRCAAARSTPSSTRRCWPSCWTSMPFNVAIADLYKTRFNGVPGVVYAAGVRHAYNVAEAFRDVGPQGAGRLGRDAQARAGAHPRRLRARRRSTCWSTRSCWPRAGTRRAPPSACTSRRPPPSASTSSASAA